MHLFRALHLSPRDTLPGTAPSSSSSTQGFDLDISGVAGFFGADVAVSAMATVHVYEDARWLGWYNQPGSYEVARRYGQLACSPFWDALYPGPNVKPAELCGFDGRDSGPRYSSVLSGTVKTKTCHVAHLFLEECRSMPASPGCQHVTSNEIPTPVSVTVAKLEHKPPAVLTPRLQQSTAMRVFAAVPIAASLAAVAGCAVLDDWFCASMVLFGMLANGVARLVVGRGTLTYTSGRPDRPLLLPVSGAQGAGVLDDGDDIVVLRGANSAINAITRSRFSLKYGSEPGYHDLGACAVLLSLQLLAQLLVVPQGVLYGQLLFLTSLAVSWAHNSYLSSPDLGTLLRRVLFQEVLRVDTNAARSLQTSGTGKLAVGPEGARMEKHEFGTRTSAVVFALLVLAEAAEGPEPPPLRRVLDALLPNDTPTWVRWKEEMVRNLEANAQWLRADPVEGGELRLAFPPLVPGEKPLLGSLYGDAERAGEAYMVYRRRWSPTA